MIGAAALLVDAILYLSLGWRPIGDAPRYLDGAQRMLTGTPLTDRQLGYFGYSAVLAALEWLHLGAHAVLWVQLILACAAAFAAWALGRRLGGPRTGLICGLLWVGFLDIQRWNFYLLTDGPFIAAVMICAYLVVAADGREWRGLIDAVAAVVAMASIRINGIVYAAFFAAFLFMGLSDRLRRSALVLLMAGAFLILPISREVFGFVARPQEQGDLVRQGTYEYMIQGHIIWNTTFTPMPPAGDPSGSGLRDAVAYVARNPVAVSKLYALRLVHYVFGYNPRYSSPHILINIATFTTLYAFAAVGLAIVWKRSRWIASLAGLWLCQAAVVIVTVGDYDNRYSLHAVPVLLPFAAVGIDRAAARFKILESSRSE